MVGYMEMEYLDCLLSLTMRQASTDDRSKISQNCHTQKCQNSILEFDDYIWNYFEEYIQISTNMPGIGVVICKISFKI